MGVGVDDPDRLFEHRGSEARRGQFRQLQDVGPADAATHDMERIDPQIIE
jgi:hypothetical protein